MSGQAWAENDESSYVVGRPRWGWLILVVILNAVTAGTLGTVVMAYLLLVKKWRVVEHNG